MLTTPLGMFGFLALFMHVTQSTTATSFLCLTYLLKLVASVPTGVFIGTFVILLICLVFAHRNQLGLFSSVLVIALAYVAQDLSHIIANEETFQATYSAGGHVIFLPTFLSLCIADFACLFMQVDLSNLSGWSALFLEHGFYLLPLCMEVFFKMVPIPSAFAVLFSAPLPTSIQPLEDWAWLLLPFACWSVGMFCIDSRNGFCVFPGSPYFSRVEITNIGTDPEFDTESRKEDMAAIREWTLKEMPPHNQSSHWWYSSLAPTEKNAFDRVANSSHIVKAFRKMFNEKHVSSLQC
jgi:hypothetical protein